MPILDHAAPEPPRDKTMQKYLKVEKACHEWYLAWEAGDWLGMDAAMETLENLDEEKGK